MDIIFDLDGTLIDSAPGILRCFRHTFGALGIEAPSEAALRSCIGPPLRDGLRSLVGEARADQAVAIYRAEYDARGLHEHAVYPGIETLIASARSHRLFVCTSKPRPFAKAILEALPFAAQFPVIFGPEIDAPHRSDKTDLLRALLDAEGIAAERAMMIGDRRFDVLAANACGVRSVGALWGYGSEEELREAGAQHIASTPADVLTLVTSLSG